jgi:hypothetical protein
MDPTWKTMIWQQFGASIEMIENALRACPEQLWSDRSQRPEFWYLTYHTLFWLDLYLTGPDETFAPPAPFTLNELDPEGRIPEQPYTKDEMQKYLEHGRNKCRATIESLTDEQARQPNGCKWLAMSFAESLLYNMRHVQHHAAQLNLILRQQTDSAPRWVAKARAKAGAR